MMAAQSNKTDLGNEDITPQSPPAETEDLKTKVDALYQEMLRDIAENGSDWPVYTSPGK